MAGCAGRVRTMLLELLPKRAGIAHGAFVQNGHVSGRRGRRRAEDVLQHILPPDHRRRARRIARDGQHARVAQYSAALISLQLHAAELWPRDAFDPVMLRQRFVQESAPRVEEIREREIFAEDWLE